MKTTPRRRQSRELALQVLFQIEFVNDINTQISLNYFKRHFEAHEQVFSYAEYLVSGTLKNLESIDKKIKGLAQNWDFSRIALIDKNILRVGIFEISYSNKEVPFKTVINEAIEIAKKYSSQDSSNFINGILDQVAKES